MVDSSPVPPLVFMPPQSSRTSAPTPTSTSIPPPSQKPISSKPDHPEDESSSKASKFPLPKLRLEIRDLNHEGSLTFLKAVIASKALEKSVQSVLSLLYHSPDSQTTTIPTTRSVTLILRSMPGVAYTTGSDLDDDHKEIHFSLDYIHGISESRKKDEIMGVLTHEMVHCFQYNAFGTCPGGLVEGIADWVRLNADLSPPHWKKEASGKWDAGYQHTGYFLEYLEHRFGKGTIRRLNEKLRIEKYHEKRFWTELIGRPVEQLWGDYSDVLEKEMRKAEEDECVLVEKEDASAPRTSNDALTLAST
ncbi:peptidase of plants and bacteria-domain-containing protein [Rhexocercosporidium sp. MPI-PUGE-AT-0058]|nr:peptidase of plants and bacteria-domain-containing protein [Rhexocercosporidium sp. MPI-PUGE-AT-0058]